MVKNPRIAVVTGASAGVGRATAIALAQRGIDVGLVARGAAGLDGAADDVRAAGARAVTAPADVADAASVEAAAERVETELGAVDLWVNNAMTTVFAPIWQIAPDEFKRATEVTYLGQVHGTMTALRRMHPRDRGTILNVGSALAFRAIPLQSAYCGAKFACRGFTEAVRAELRAANSSVRVAMVHLPAVNTPQFGWCLNRLPKHPQPVAPVYSAEVAARAIVQMAHELRRDRLLGAFTTLMVWANKLAPGVVDHYLARTGIASQQASIDADPDRPVTLWKPVDDPPGTDHGLRGMFHQLEGGMLNPQMLRSIPSQLRDVVASLATRTTEQVGQWRTRARRGAVEPVVGADRAPGG